MRRLLLIALAIATTAELLPAAALQLKIDPGAGAWLIVADIPPFALGGTIGAAASLTTGGGGIGAQFLGNDPQDVFAQAHYTDAVRGMLVDVQVIRNGRTAFLDHLVEAVFRDGSTGRLDLPESTIASILGGTLFFFCDKPSACKRRDYMWRSGSNLVVRISAHAASHQRMPDGFPKVDAIPCPEPTEVLQAYLQRYPSALSFYTEDDAHAKRWRHDQAALELVSADYHLDQTGGATPEHTASLLDAARDHLTSFAELRRVAFGGPSATKEAERIAAVRQLPAATQLAELNKIRNEYRQWWNAHQNDPVYLPPP